MSCDSDASTKFLEFGLKEHLAHTLRLRCHPDPGWFLQCSSWAATGRCFGSAKPPGKEMTTHMATPHIPVRQRRFTFSGIVSRHHNSADRYSISCHSTPYYLLRDRSISLPPLPTNLLSLHSNAILHATTVVNSTLATTILLASWQRSTDET